MRKHWLLICFINFFIAASMGLVLRFVAIFPVPNINYQFLLHGHSHVAMLGWVYLMIYSLIVHFFYSKNSAAKPHLQPIILANRNCRHWNDVSFSCGRLRFIFYYFFYAAYFLQLLFLSISLERCQNQFAT